MLLSIANLKLINNGGLQIYNPTLHINLIIVINNSNIYRLSLDVRIFFGNNIKI